jgi:hypothetical protein
MDKYDPCIYDEAFGNICRTHGHVIPTDDYSGHRHAVNAAIADVIGPIEGRLLRSITSWKGSAAGMPSSQSVLLWVKETMPSHFREVLERTKHHDNARHVGAP